MEKVQTSKMDVPACPSQFMAIFMEQIIGFKPWDVDFFQWIPSMAMRMSPASHWQVGKDKQQELGLQDNPFGSKIETVRDWDPVISSYI